MYVTCHLPLGEDMTRLQQQCHPRQDMSNILLPASCLVVPPCAKCTHTLRHSCPGSMQTSSHRKGTRTIRSVARPRLHIEAEGLEAEIVEQTESGVLTLGAAIRVQCK